MQCKVRFLLSCASAQNEFYHCTVLYALLIFHAEKNVTLYEIST